MQRIFTNGCFDMLHIGHIRLLQYARSLGTELIVGLNSDASIKRLKGNNRPIFNERIRRETLLALKCVDEVIIFNDDTPIALIERLKPAIIVKGRDYSAASVVGNNIATVFIFDAGIDISTSILIEKLRAQG